MSNQTWTIIANAQTLRPEQLAIYPFNSHILVCDGAYNYTKHLAVDVVLGDFDSIDMHDDIKQEKPLFIETPDQNSTDLQKAIEYCDSRHATSITILNALDNQMSHSLHNLSLLKRMHRMNRPLHMLHAIQDNNPSYPTSGIEAIYYLYNQHLSLEGPKDSSISLYGFPSCVISSQGLEWDLNDRLLNLATIDSSRNRLQQAQAQLQIQGDALLMIDHAIQVYFDGNASVKR